MPEPLKECSQLETVTLYKCQALKVKNRHTYISTTCSNTLGSSSSFQNQI